MDYTPYTTMIDRAIDELTDIREQLTQAGIEACIPKCNPIRVENPAPGLCIPNIVDLKVVGIEAEITAWIQEAVNRIIIPPTPPESPGKS